MVESIYSFDLLNNSISWLLKSKKISFRDVSLGCCIHPSYFSRVMKGAAGFSQEQIFKISTFLKLCPQETDYLFLLWNKFQAQSTDEKLFFKSKIQEIQEEKQKISSKLKQDINNPAIQKERMEIYYEDIITAVIHMYLTISEYRNSPEKILNTLKISKEKLSQEISKLKKLGLIQLNGNKIQSVEQQIHLDPKSNLCTLNHIQWRLKVIQKLNEREDDSKDLHLSVAISIDEESKVQIKNIIREAILTIQQTVSNCKAPQKIYYLMIDFF